MDFGLDGAATTIASSTTGYLVEFSPVIILVAGLVLALVVIERIIDFFRGGDTMDRADN